MVDRGTVRATEPLRRGRELVPHLWHLPGFAVTRRFLQRRLHLEDRPSEVVGPQSEGLLHALVIVDAAGVRVLWSAVANPHVSEMSERVEEVRHRLLVEG